MNAVVNVHSESAVRGALAFLERRQIGAIERVSEDCYERLGTARATLQGQSLYVDGIETVKLQALLGLDAPLDVVRRHFERDPLLGPLQKEFGPVVVPGCWSPFELSVRAILGQQVSVAAARTIAGRVVERWGEGTRFPGPEALADAPLEEAGIVRQRASCIRGLAKAVREGSVRFADESMEQLTSLKGFGEWTAQYIAMRAFRNPDAFPAGDLVLRRVAANGRAPLTESELLKKAEAWRPWRAYAVILLWRSA